MGSNFLVLGFYTFTSLFNSSRKTTVTTVTLRKQFVCYDNAKSLSKNKCDKSSKFNQSIRELQYCYIGPFTLSCSGECSTNVCCSRRLPSLFSPLWPLCVCLFCFGSYRQHAKLAVITQSTRIHDCPQFATSIINLFLAVKIDYSNDNKTSLVA